MRKILGTLLAICVILPNFFFSKQAVALDLSSTQNYLSSKPLTPWGIIALSAMGQTPANLNLLKNLQAQTAIDFESPILALAAAKQNPQNFDGQNYVNSLKNFYTSGQIGDSNLINDDVFGILALISANEPLTSPIIQDSKNFLLQNQVNGCWGWSVSAPCDSDTTALAALALYRAGLDASHNAITNSLTYLKNNQNPDGGMAPDKTSDWGKASSISSSAWTLWLLNALGINDATWSGQENSISEYLQNNQNQEGYFGSSETSFTPIETAYAVIALSGKSLPIVQSGQMLPFAPQVFYRIEGSNETLCNGAARAANAMDLIKNVSTACGFDYYIKTTSFGPYLEKIGANIASGTVGWQYAVNWQSPQVGAIDYILKPDDEVVWYFGEFDLKLARLHLPQTEIGSNSPFEAKVEAKGAEGSFVNLSDATISASSRTFYTGSDGIANITNLPDGYYQIKATKNGYVRSNSVLVKVGNPNSGALDLAATVRAGEVLGSSTQETILAFTINETSLNFGELKQAASSEKQFSISNTGTANLNISAVVYGDAIFTENLKLDNVLWKKFQTSLDRNVSKTIKASLTVPAQTPEGAKSGRLIIWAQVK